MRGSTLEDDLLIGVSRGFPSSSPFRGAFQTGGVVFFPSSAPMV